MNAVQLAFLEFGSPHATTVHGETGKQFTFTKHRVVVVVVGTSKSSSTTRMRLPNPLRIHTHNTHNVGGYFLIVVERKYGDENIILLIRNYE